jgi:hypothetical protein
MTLLNQVELYNRTAVRLKKEQIQKISEKIFKSLQEKGLIKLKTSEETALSRIEKAIVDDLAAEDRLDDDVQKIMDQYRPLISSGQMNEQEVFQKIKKQLIKERKLVI